MKNTLFAVRFLERDLSSIIKKQAHLFEAVHVFTPDGSEKNCGSSCLPLQKDIPETDTRLFFPFWAGEKRKTFLDFAKKRTCIQIKQLAKNKLLLTSSTQDAGIPCISAPLYLPIKKAVKTIKRFCRFKKHKAVIFDITNTTEAQKLVEVLSLLNPATLMPFEFPQKKKRTLHIETGLPFKGSQPERLSPTSIKDPAQCFPGNRELEATMHGDISLSDNNSLFHFCEGRLIGINNKDLSIENSGPSWISPEGIAVPFDIVSAFSFEGDSCRGLRAVYGLKDNAEVIIDHLFIEETNLFVIDIHSFFADTDGDYIPFTLPYPEKIEAITYGDKENTLTKTGHYYWGSHFHGANTGVTILNRKKLYPVSFEIVEDGVAIGRISINKVGEKTAHDHITIIYNPDSPEPLNQLPAHVLNQIKDI